MRYESETTEHSHFAPKIATNPGFEIFFALQNVLDPAAQIHRKWHDEALRYLPSSFFEKAKRICPNPLVWPNLADALGPLTLVTSIPELLQRLAEVNVQTFANNILEGVLHNSADARDLLDGRLDLDAAVSRSTPEKRDWLTYIGLYPYVAKSPYATFVSNLIQKPDDMKSDIINLLNDFNRLVFDHTWQSLEEDLKRSTGRMARLYATSSFEEFARLNLLRIIVDEKSGTISAVRGGYTVSFDDIDDIHLMPSAFNERRLWNAVEDKENGLTTIMFPCFDPELIPLSGAGHPEPSALDLDLDAALIFKALGDNTRYAVAMMIAEAPTTAVDLAGRLSLSKPTVSHHVQKLRLAGLIDEEWNNGSVTLSLRRAVIEKLSSLALHALYPDNPQ